MYKGVEFYEEDNFSSSLKQRPKHFSFITGLAIKFGLAKDEQSANKALLLIAVVLFMFSIFVFVLSNQSPEPLSPQELQFSEITP